MNFNKIFVAGNLSADPVLRNSGGTSVCTFALAINSGRPREGKSDVTFIDCVAFKATAEAIAANLHKGSNCFVEGRINRNEWTDKTTGQKRSKIEVIVESVQFLGRASAPATSGQDEDLAPDNSDIPY